MPSRFFSAFLTFLPEAKSRAELETLVRLAGVVPFDEAEFKVNPAGPGRIKVFLHIRIPDYNLNLNLNMEIQVDSNNIFQAMSQLTQMFGAPPP